ncbi:spore coat protein CotH [Chloropicon primus]|uniref:Spore coat protein CotH n=2 Tax=Chloropicon primus TaxID=1764295 RepID=A0A5B8MEB5_9CHLO|nr:spore coat protein CotH [Chloropicon primus]UPQ96858.1 spore coat protein CotH [Chloropicon primus]|eukprot:QDZ17642.1 spore coat protein CotH [Chloropicon primus]
MATSASSFSWSQWGRLAVAAAALTLALTLASVGRSAAMLEEELPERFRPLSGLEVALGLSGLGQVRRETVDGSPCELPLRIGGDRWAVDCVEWWDGQEWCVSIGDGMWHACKPRAPPPGRGRSLLGSGGGTGATVGSLLASVSAPPPAPASPEPPSAVPAFVPPEPKAPVLSGPVTISEFMASNKATYRDKSDGSYPDWIEIHNASPAEVDLEGWQLTDDPGAPGKWTFPTGVSVPSRGYVLVLASGKGGPGRGGKALHANFKLESGGGYLGLRDPRGVVASEWVYPPQHEDVSYGTSGGNLRNLIARAKDQGESSGKDEDSYGYLQNPTPRMRNSYLRLMGPGLFEVTRDPEVRPSPGEDYQINATIYRGAGGGDLPAVTLYYKPGFLADTMVEMVPTGDVTELGGIVYSAKIPGASLQAGSMIRWYVTARAGQKISLSRSPEVKGIGDPQYYGTVVSSRNEGRTNLPVMHLFSANAGAATSQKGGVASVFYDNRFYDNVKTRRRGQTTISWEKPKLKLDFKGKVFKFADGERKVEEFNLQSHYVEIGSQTYMREDLGSQVLLEAGVPTPIVFPLDLWMNGKFYGLYSFVEQIDDTFLKRNKLPTSGPLYKAWHQWKSNLRWDVETDDMQWAYRKGNLKDVKIHEDRLGSYDDLKNFTLGLVGKGRTRDSWSRTNYLYQHVSIPEVINELAAQNLIINQDRLTKNFYVYYDPSTAEWMKLPWDLEAAFGLSPKLGGQPSELYCVLACEQFNSPLYGDSEHPQDIRDFFDGGRWNRKLQFIYRPPTPSYWGGHHHSNEEPEWTCEDPGQDGTQCFGDKSPRYADGTFNYLYDAVLDVKSTREMYLRRLRTLMDHFMNGRLEQMITEHYKQIRPSAKLDNSIWKRGDIDEGYEQLLTEQLPLRREQLYDTYGPSGSGLIPGPQKENPRAGIEVEPRYGVIEISNKEQEAIDVSGWEVQGGVRYSLKPGTVIPSDSKLVLCGDVLKCKKMGKYADAHLLVVGPFKGSLPDQAGGIRLLDAKGRLVDEL